MHAEAEAADELSGYLGRCSLLVEEAIAWVHMRLRLTSYLVEALPPLEFVTSVRCLLFREDAVLVQRDVDGVHILPGGRREAGESLEQTLRREVLEETGWAIGSHRLLGCLHYHHLTPRPTRYPYPYPDFLQVVYVAEATSHLPERMLDDGIELESVFRSPGMVRSLSLPAGQQRFLEAALRIRVRRS